MDKVFVYGGVAVFGLALIAGFIALVSYLSMLAWNFIVPGYPVTFFQALAAYFLLVIVGGCFKSTLRAK